MWNFCLGCTKSLIYIKLNFKQDVCLHLDEQVYMEIYEIIIDVTFSNHFEIIVIYWTNRECVWLRNLTYHISASLRLASENDRQTTFNKNKTACIAQIKECYIKEIMINHFFLKILLHREAS